MEKIDDIWVDFIIEAREILDQLDLDFVRLEETPGDSKLVGNIFRGVHTLKGEATYPENLTGRTVYTDAVQRESDTAPLPADQNAV